MRILVTGSTGFIGSALVERLHASSDHQVRAAVRQAARGVTQKAELVSVGDLGPDADWSHALRAVDVVIHTAARVHVMRNATSDPLAAFRYANTAGTLALARQAAHASVSRFVYLSSIKVNGEETVLDRPFQPDDAPHPQDAYGVSKCEAEEGLQQLAAASDMQIVLVRPPLVYGPGVKANFLSMMRWVHRGVPLPFAAVTSNRRSLVALENLVDFLVTCADHPSAANQTFLVSDGEDLSTADLLNRIAASLGRPSKQFAVSPSMLFLGARLARRTQLARRLLGTLQVDLSKTRDMLSWRPPISVDRGLELAARHFLDRENK